MLFRSVSADHIGTRDLEQEAQSQVEEVLEEIDTLEEAVQEQEQGEEGVVEAPMSVVVEGEE